MFEGDRCKNSRFKEQGCRLTQRGVSAFRVDQAIFECSKLSIKLSLITVIKQSAHVRTRLDPQFQQVTAHDNGRRRLTVHFQLACSGQQPLTGRKSIKLFRWPACMIGPRHTHQSVDALDLPCQSADCAVRSVGVMEGTRTEMAQYQRDHLIDQAVLVGQSLKKTLCGACPFRFMSSRADVSIFFFGRGRFAEVVAEDAQPDGQVIRLITGSLRSKPIQAVERVNPDVAFRVPDGILWAAFKGREFRIETEPAAVT